MARYTAIEKPKEKIFLGSNFRVVYFATKDLRDVFLETKDGRAFCCGHFSDWIKKSRAIKGKAWRASLFLDAALKDARSQIKGKTNV